MRRFAVLLALLALCLTGCGSGHDDKAVTPLDDALGYFPKDSPFVAAVQTDPNGDQVKQLTALVGRFPGIDILAGRIENLAQVPFVRWNRDIRPQLGAPLVIGLSRPATGNGVARAVVVAMRVKHPIRVKQVLLRQPGFRGDGKSSGVRIYQNTAQHRYAAVDGDVVVAGTDRATVVHALATKRSDKRMREGAFNRDLATLPTGGLVRVSADPKALIAADSARRPALSVKWLASLQRFGAVLKAVPTGITLDFRAATDSGAIGDGDLPLAPKAGVLPLIGRRGEVEVGVREPNRLAHFAFQIAHAMAPRRMALLRALEPNGIDLERQIQHHLKDYGVLAYDPLSHAVAARADLNEPGDVKSALSTLTPALPAVGALFGIKGLGVATPEPGESFYALARPKGGTVVFGVVGNTLVAASQAPRAAGLASESTHTAPHGVTGSAVVTVNARELAGKLLAKQLGGPAALIAPLAVASLRDLTGALAISRDGLRGHFKLTIVK